MDCILLIVMRKLKGTPNEKMEEALNSTGRAVFLSAITTIIGFISLTFTPMAPIQTVGWSLAFGIVVVYDDYVDGTKFDNIT